MTSRKKIVDLEQAIEELTLDLQRTRADFENYRKRVESEKQNAALSGELKAIMKLLPVIDTIERAVTHVPADISENQWVKGVVGLVKQLEKALQAMDLHKIEASTGTQFNPELHQAIQFDEDAEGANEIIAEELQSGYTLRGAPVRHSMVKVTRRD